MQTTLDFTHAENNRESEMHYIENAEHFSEQCMKVLTLLRSGVRLTVRSAILEHGISSLPRRIKDCRTAGVEIKDEWIKPTDKPKYKQYYI